MKDRLALHHIALHVERYIYSVYESSSLPQKTAADLFCLTLTKKETSCATACGVSFLPILRQGVEPPGSESLRADHR